MGAAAEKAAAEKAAVEKAAAEKAAAAKAAAEAAAKAKNEAAEAAAIKKAEEELKEQLRMEQVNADLGAAHKKKQDAANEKFKQAKAALEANGAEFVSNEEFDKHHQEAQLKCPGRQLSEVKSSELILFLKPEPGCFRQVPSEIVISNCSGEFISDIHLYCPWGHLLMSRALKQCKLCLMV